MRCPLIPPYPCNTEWHLTCQGPSHGGSYMNKGTFCIRIRLLLIVVSGDFLTSFPTPCLPYWSLVHVRCQMIQGCTSTSPPLFPFLCMRPWGLYLLVILTSTCMVACTPWWTICHAFMMDCLSPCLLMLHGILHDTITSSYCTWFAVLWWLVR